MTLARWWDIIRLRLRSLARRDRIEDELEKELRFHVAQQIEENLASGMPPGEARHAALRKLGGLAQIEEECRDMRRTAYIENLAHDLRYAFRMLAASPGFAIVIVLTLALSIGANSAIFSVIDGVLLRPLPYPEADRLVRVFLHSQSYAKFPLILSIFATTVRAAAHSKLWPDSRAVTCNSPAPDSPSASPASASPPASSMFLACVRRAGASSAPGMNCLATSAKSSSATGCGVLILHPIRKSSVARSCSIRSHSPW